MFFLSQRKRVCGEGECGVAWRGMSVAWRGVAQCGRGVAWLRSVAWHTSSKQSQLAQ